MDVPILQILTNLTDTKYGPILTKSRILSWSIQESNNSFDQIRLKMLQVGEI